MDFVMGGYMPQVHSVTLEEGKIVFCRQLAGSLGSEFKSQEVKLNTH